MGPLIAVVVTLVFLIIIYNSLISKVNQIKNAEGSLDATLKQRYDLLPNLVEVAKQYMDHEEKMFTKIIELRSRAVSTHNMHETIETNKELDSALKNFMVNVENYPTLLSNQNFVKIQESLMDLENNIAASRRFYNTSVVAYNEAIQMIPGNLFAPLMGLRTLEIYSIPESEKVTPNMKEMFKK
jgi:LemA protein